MRDMFVSIANWAVENPVASVPPLVAFVLLTLAVAFAGRRNS